MTGTPYRLRDPAAPVAVLFGSRTASSGEVVAISFIGRPNTQSFGSTSSGLTTTNQGYPMSDGAILVLTTAVDADRTGRAYGGPLALDVRVAGENGEAGPVPAEALAWLASQPACR